MKKITQIILIGFLAIIGLYTGFLIANWLFSDEVIIPRNDTPVSQPKSKIQFNEPNYETGK
jgi:hypothetical protein